MANEMIVKDSKWLHDISDKLSNILFKGKIQSHVLHEDRQDPEGFPQLRPTKCEDRFRNPNCRSVDDWWNLVPIQMTYVDRLQ